MAYQENGGPALGPGDGADRARRRTSTVVRPATCVAARRGVVCQLEAESLVGELETTIPRLAMVTGASSGIGEAYAERLAAGHWDLVVAARRTERLSDLAARLTGVHGARVRPIEAGLSRPSDVQRISAVSGMLARGQGTVINIVSRLAFGGAIKAT